MSRKSLTTSQAASRAAAYTVAVLAYGVRPAEVSIAETEGEYYWIPWVTACGCCDAKNASSLDWSRIAILAAEVIALRPEKQGVGPKWNTIAPKGMKIARQLTQVVPNEDDPLYWVGSALCGAWWDSAKGNDRRRRIERAEARFMLLWHQAMEIVRRYQPQIRDLTKILKADEYMSAEEVHTWWNNVPKAKVA